MTPKDCAWVIGIPLDREHFLADSASGASDYASGLMKALQLSPEGAWRVFEPVADLARKICDEAVAAGVLVVRAASLSDFASAFPGHTVVTLFTHCRWPPLGVGDLINPDGLAAAIGRDTSSAGQALRMALRGHGWTGGAAAGADFATALNSTVEQAHAEFERRRGGSERYACTRPALERHYGPLLREAAVVEFRDGMHLLSAVAAQIPISYRGTLDLTLCHSALLTPALKQWRPSSIFISNRRAADPLMRLALYRAVLRLLQRTHRSFEAALADVITAAASASQTKDSSL